MNNWRLLLLAIVAVFQPIASFTDRNLIDGRQQCCDRLSSAPLQDTRSSLHGTYRLGKTTSELRRLNDRDEVHEDRRYELMQRDSIFSRLSTERPLVDIRGRVERQGPSVIARSSRVEYHLERPANSQNRERLLVVHQKKETVRSIRDLKSQDVTRKVFDRTSRGSLERRNDRAYTESPRNDLIFRHDYRTERLSNERLSQNVFDSQRETNREQIRSVERRITLNRDARRVLSRTKDDVPSIDNRQRIARERLSVVRRESVIRPDTRRYSKHNDERRDLQRNNEQRRSLSENTQLENRIRDMRIRLNAREDNQENRQRISASQRLSSERFEEHREQREDRRESRQQNKENIDRSSSGERMQVARRITRESRIMMNEVDTRNERNVGGRREIRHNERMSRNIQDEIRENPDQRLSRERIQTDRRNLRESRIMSAQNKREVEGRHEIRLNRRISRDTREEFRDNLEQRLSRERIQVDRRDTSDSRNTNTQNVRDVNDRREIRHSRRVSRNTRDETKDHNINRLSLERTQIDRANIREFRVINNLVTRDDDRRFDSKREMRYNNRMSRETRDESKVITDHRLPLERIQMERRNIRELRTTNTPNDKNVYSRREIRYNERLTEIRKETRQNPEQRISPEKIQIDRRYFREFRNMKNTVIQTEKDVESRREIRTDASLQTKNMENPGQRLSSERIQMDRRNTRESRTVNHLHEKDLDSRQEIRYNERLSRETREELRDNPDRSLARESRQVDRRNILESRINRVNTRNERSIETDPKSRREIRYNERLSGEIRGDQVTREHRVESRSVDRVNAEERDSSIMNRGARSADRRNFREIRADLRLSRSANAERGSEVLRNRVEHSRKIENRERDATDARSRNVELSRNRERISSVMVGKMETENDFTVADWQYVLYTLQAAYLCALFMQMLTPRRTEKSNKMSLRWLPVSSYYNPIKVD